MEHAPAQRVGIIDLGSNTGRLIVMYAVPGYTFRLVDEIREVVRLRAGMTDEGLSQDAIERAMFTLRLFKGFCDATEVDHVIATTTSAVRQALNGPAFVEKVKMELGLELEILSGEREAYFGAVGALNEVPMTDGWVMDIGGGSIQISEIQSREWKRGRSLKLGALALTEEYVTHDPVTEAEYQAIGDEIQRQLETIDWLQSGRGRMAGLGGTIRNLAKIETKRMDYPLNTLHGYKLSRSSVDESINLFRELPLEKRQNISGLSQDRADIILPGAMVLSAVMDRLDCDEISISVNGIREGLFLARFLQHLPTPIIPDIRKFSVLNMARNYSYQKDHANHVRHLCNRLFDQLSSLHELAKPEQELLDAAALLHDLGTVINYDDHHKHSQTLIENAGLPGYAPRETAIIALLARYHRKGNPDIDDYEVLLNKEDECILTKLAAILRLAEYLERGRSGAVEDVSASWDEDSLRFSLLADVYPAVELWQARQLAAPLLEEAFDRKVTIDSVAAPDAGWQAEESALS